MSLFIPAGALWVETTYARPVAGGEDPAILLRLTQMINDTPAGGTIHATIFRLTVESVRDELVAAARRGVRVRVVHNGRDVTNPVGASLSREMPDGLGSEGHRWSGQPYDHTGQRADYGGVATGRNADLHTKIFLFSATKDPLGELRSHVTWWASANLSHHSGMRKSNNAISVYGDPLLYERFRTRLWDLLWSGTHFARNDFYNGNLRRGSFLGSPDSKTKVFCSPEQDTDLWVGRLASVVVDGDTRVDLAHVRFTDARLVVARQLVAIQAAGGVVRVVVGADPGFLGPEVRATLEAAGIPLRIGDIHDKLVVVHSRYGASRRPRKVVFSGSHNLNHDANYVNDEILVKTFNDDVYDDMAAHIEHLWSTGTPPAEPDLGSDGPGTDPDGQGPDG